MLDLQQKQFAAFEETKQRGKTYSWVLEKVEEEDLENHQDSFFQLGELFSESSAKWNIFNFSYLRWNLLQWSIVPCGHI